MDLATERGIYRSTYISTSTQRVKINYPLIIKNFEDQVECVIYDSWDHNCLFFMDILATKFIEIANNNSIPGAGIENIKFKFTKEQLENFIENSKSSCYENKYRWNYKITDSKLKSQFYPTQQYSSTQIFNIFSKISNCKFNLTYPVRIFDKDTNKFTIYKYSNFDSTAMSFLTLDSKVLKEHKKGVSEREYFITFNSVLGSLFLINCFSMNIDWVPINFCEQPKYVQLIYKMIVLQKNNYVNLTTNFILSKLGLSKNQISYSYKIIHESLNALESLKLIKSWGESGSHKKWNSYNITKL